MHQYEHHFYSRPAANPTGLGNSIPIHVVGFVLRSGASCLAYALYQAWIMLIHGHALVLN